MKFRFCGDLDCPDWVLAEINILSKLTSVKMRLLCAQVINSILGTNIDYEKVIKITADAKFGRDYHQKKLWGGWVWAVGHFRQRPIPNLPRVSSDDSLCLETEIYKDVGDIKASIAALSFIIRSAAKFDVDSETLSNELQQLGLPKEHTTPLCKLYGDNLIKCQEKLRKESLRLSRLDSVQWRVDYVISSKALKTVNEPSVQLCLKVRNPDTGISTPVAFNLTAEKFRVFLNELKQADAIMDNLS